MSLPLETKSLPDYEQPPVVETILGVQFERMPNWTNAHAGAFWKTLDGTEWPTTADAQPIQPQYERFGDSAQWARGLKIQISQSPAARLQITNKAGNRMIQLQNGRMHFNWLGSDGGGYPRYSAIRSEFGTMLSRFQEYCAREQVGDLRPNQWEVTYINLIPQGTVWNSAADWGFFRPLGAMPTIDNLVAAESFSGEWHFEIPKQQGRLHIDWRHIERTKPESDDDLAAIQLNLTARGPLESAESTSATILERLDLGHDTIVSAFQELMSDSANRYWKLKNGHSNA